MLHFILADGMNLDISCLIHFLHPIFPFSDFLSFQPKWIERERSDFHLGTQLYCSWLKSLLHSLQLDKAIFTQDKDISCRITARVGSWWAVARLHLN